jgi:hypothetical protein
MNTRYPQPLQLIAVLGLALLPLAPAAVSQQFTFALAAKHTINFNGNGFLTDSFDSSNPAKSTNGRYDASKYAGDIGDVVIDDSIIVDVGNGKIYGKLHTGTNGGYSFGPNGGIGTHAWLAANGGGVQPGYLLQDANLTFPDTTLPDTTGYLTPQPGDIVLYQTNSVLVTNHYDNVLEAYHNYVSSALTGNSIILGPNVKLVLPNGLSGAENLFFNYTDNVIPGVTVYAGGTSASINGNQYINPSGFAGSLIVYCAPTVTSFTLNGNGQFTGVLVAPNADLALNDGGDSDQDLSGSLMVNSVHLNGHFSFHYDEALGRLPGSPPWIITQPQSRTVAVGQPATFTVSATGSPPLGYQWQFAGTDIPSATNSSFTLPSASTTDAGLYSVIITNASGSAASSNAVLTVSGFLFIAAQPQSQTVGVGSNVTFNVTVYGAPPFVYRWYFNGTPLGSPAPGTNFLSCTLTNVGTNQAGNYSVEIVNGYGRVTSSNAVLTVKVFPPSITVQPSSLLVLQGTSADFTVSVNSTAPFGHQWRFNGTNILHATNAFYSIPSVGTDNAGYYAVVITNAAGSATTSNAALTVVLSPTSHTNYASSTATFTATAFGPVSLNYQWQKDGTNLVEGGRLSGTTNSTLTIASVSDADAANYSAVVSDAYSSLTTSNAALTVINPPSITAQPLGQQIMLGSSVSFNVSVSGTAPFSYQWRFNGANVPNATNATYAAQAVGVTNTGNYSVVVTNLAGSATSSNALLTVIIPPTLALELWAGYPLLSLNGMLNSNFVVQYSTNLGGSNWTDLLSLTNLPYSPYLFLDPGGGGEPARFYRAFMQ